MILSVLKVFRAYTFQRSLTAVLLFSSVLLGARTIDQVAYAQILQIMFLGKFLAIGNLGAASGFFVSCYGKVGMLKTNNVALELRYCLIMLAQLLVIFVPVLLISVFIAPKYTLGIFIFILLIPAYVIEPPSRLRRKFYVSLAPDILMSGALLVVSIFAAIGLSTNFLTSPTIYVGIVGLLAIAFYTVIFFHLPTCFSFSIETLRGSLKEYLKTVILGIPVYLGTALFMLASGLDRLLMPIYIAAEGQALYFLSYQLATGAMIFLASTNFINTVDLGEAHKSGSDLFIVELQRKLKLSVGLAALSVFFLLIASISLQRLLLPEYKDLVGVTVTLAVGLSAFFVAGSITPILGYLRKQLALTIAMGLVVIVVLINNLVAIQIGLSIAWLSSITAAAFVMYSLFAILYTFSTVRG